MESPLLRSDKARGFARNAVIFSALSLLAPVVFIPFAFFFGIQAAVRGEARKGVAAIVIALLIGAIWLIVALKGH